MARSSSKNNTSAPPQTGEGSGLYVWAPDMIVVDRLSDGCLRDLVDELVAEGELQQRLMLLNEDD